MKKFKFSLETVLKIRKIAVDKEVRSLSVVVGNMNKIQNEVRNNNRNLHLATSQYSATDIKTLKLYENYFKGLSLQNESLNLKLHAQESSLNEARNRVIEVEKNMKVIEIIKNRQLKEFKDRIIQSERLEEEEINKRLFIQRNEEAEDEEIKNIPIPIRRKVPTVKPVKDGVKSEYEKLMDFIGAQQPKK